MARPSPNIQRRHGIVPLRCGGLAEIKCRRSPAESSPDELKESWNLGSDWMPPSTIYGEGVPTE